MICSNTENDLFCFYAYTFIICTVIQEWISHFCIPFCKYCWANSWFYCAVHISVISCCKKFYQQDEMSHFLENCYHALYRASQKGFQGSWLLRDHCYIDQFGCDDSFFGHKDEPLNFLSGKFFLPTCWICRSSPVVFLSRVCSITIRKITQGHWLQLL